ncbi:hypothetical protein SELMODRAFT_428857 [Selaginella moellendorffii]|uniref:Uncharacterized protein n=1 Tax=Selaginella moellendorffii TaxID=88036 RepID=D8T484_SELML|nr:hypothetical protein SELMODRAFT_428857 [Selaginella moellendorffii]
MELILKGEGLWGVVNGDELKTGADVGYQKVDKLQLSRVILAVKEEIIMQKDVGIFHSKSDQALFTRSSFKQFVKKKNNNKVSKDGGFSKVKESNVKSNKDTKKNKSCGYCNKFNHEEYKCRRQ